MMCCVRRVDLAVLNLAPRWMDIEIRTKYDYSRGFIVRKPSASQEALPYRVMKCGVRFAGCGVANWPWGKVDEFAHTRS